MNSIVYQKQFQSAAAAVRMTQPFPAQFAPQVGDWWLPTNKSVSLYDLLTLTQLCFLRVYRGAIQIGILKMKWREKTDFKIKTKKKTLSDLAN